MQTLIRRRVLRHLIWVCTVCQCPKCPGPGNFMKFNQTVQILIRRRVLRRLIWVCTVCECPSSGLGQVWLRIPCTESALIVQKLAGYSLSYNKCVQRRLGTGWSESSLSAWWRFGSLTTHRVLCEDWSDYEDLSFRWVHMHSCRKCSAPLKSD